MSWLSVSFVVPAAAADAVTDALLEAGAAAVELADADAGTPSEEARFAEPVAEPPRPWKRSRVSALLPATADCTAVVCGACAKAAIAGPQFDVRRVAERDWVQASREQFAPIRISPRLWIVPSWLDAPEPGAVNLVLDPGLAFGTGSHASTRLCLRWLERVIRGGESVLDYGCGSGILAIAALKLGAARAEGVDIDDQALLAARHNALHNQVPATFYGAAGALRPPAQIVVANILAHPLIVLAPLLARLTAPRGRLALAGLLAGQAGEVRAGYEPWFDFDPPEEDEGWTLLGGVRR